MKFTVETTDGVVVIELKKSLEGGPDTFEIKDEIATRLSAGERKFLLDMTASSFVNSTGIGVVVAAQSSITNAGGQLKICGVGDRARRAFVVTGVWSLFDVYDNRKEAMDSFAG